MGCCTRRHFLLTICTFQLITIIERQVFDFLGFMWAPILANFFHIIFVIFGFFGCYQIRAKYIVTYAIWNFFWIGWNALLVCFYLSVGELDKNSFYLNFGSVSWFESNGYGCQPVFSTNLTADVPVWPIRPERVDHCLLDYEWIEIGHSGLQLALSVLALLGSLLIAKMFYDEDDQSTYKSGTKSAHKAKHRQSLYSIEFSPPLDTIRSGHHNHHHHHQQHGHQHHHADDLLDYDTTNDLGAVGGGAGPPLSPKPMTPRRVKRRSVMTRGTSGRHSTTSRHGGVGGTGTGTSSRQSQRASRRKYHQSTVTKLMEQQQQQQQHQLPPHPLPSTAFQHNATHSASQRRYPTFQRTDNPALTESNLKYLNTDPVQPPPPPPDTSSDNNNPYGTAAGAAAPSHRYTVAPPPPPPALPLSLPDPIYYNMEPPNSARMQHHSQQIHQQHMQQQQQQQLNLQSHMGHYNPTYQHSNPNLNTMPLEPPPPAPTAATSTTTLADDLLYAQQQHHHQHHHQQQPQRPPSVRSSYSNFHGTRHPNSASASTMDAAENVFASLGSSHSRERDRERDAHHQFEMQPQNSGMNLPPPPPPLASAIAPAPVAAPYLPPRKSASRESIRFLNNGPPAYNLNYHTPPDSETTM